MCIRDSVGADRTTGPVEREGHSLEDYLAEHMEFKEQLEQVWEKGIDQSCEGGG